MDSRFICLLSWASICLAQQLPLENADFQSWQNGRPEGWRVSFGAGDPQRQPSQIEALAGGGLALAGGAETGAWRLLSQDFEAEQGRVYALGFRARALELRRDANQYRNFYLGLVFRDAQDQVLLRTVQNVHTADWQDDRLVATAPEGTRRVEVALFLSLSGRLEVEWVALRCLQPEDSFELLAMEMDRRYSFFAHKGFDWQAQVDAYRPRAAEAVEPDAFAALMLEMLAPLEDPHVWVRVGEGQLQVPWSETPPLNFAARACVAALDDVQQLGRFGLLGRSPEGFGYLCVGSLQLSEADYQRLEDALRSLFDAPALILDLRANSGGNEQFAQRLVGLLCSEPRVYARNQHRNGPGHDDFEPARDRVLQPAAEQAYERPLAVLLGPGCVSSGEGMAMMLQALPQAELIGQPTRGASGNPAWLQLPNGVQVAFSRWKSLEPDGTCIEGRGVQPDQLLPHEGAGDPTLQAAIEYLRAAVE